MLAGAVTAAVIVAVIAAAVTMISARDTAPPPGTTAPAPTPSASARPVRRDRTEPAPTPAPAPTVATRSARLADLDNEQVTPVSLDVDAIGITGAPVDAVGVETDGAMEIPVDVSRVGWYEYGPAPGADAGSAVLTAHIDSRTQGRGVFYDLDALDAGDTVDVGMSDGSSATFAVDEIRQVPKVDLPTGDIFRRDGDARLALITCGGAFDETSRHYLDNLVVFATPAG